MDMHVAPLNEIRLSLLGSLRLHARNQRRASGRAEMLPISVSDEEWNADVRFLPGMIFPSQLTDEARRKIPDSVLARLLGVCELFYFIEEITSNSRDWMGAATQMRVLACD